MSSRFSITQAVLHGFGFAKSEARSLMRMAVLPLGASVVTQVAIGLETDNNLSPYAEFIYTLPALILSARFMFQIARLQLMRERDDRLPADPAYIAARQHAMRASVLLWLVLNAAATVIVGYFEWLNDLTQAVVLRTSMTNAPPVVSEAHMLYNIVGILLMVCALWGIRFAAAPFVAAVDYPLNSYLRRVKGFGISLRLVGMGLLVGFPASFAYLGILELLAPDGKIPPPAPFILFVVLNNIVAFVYLSVLSSGTCFALKEILSRGEDA